MASILCRVMQDLVELQVSAVLAGSEENVGQRGCQGDLGSKGRRCEHRSPGTQLRWGCCVGC